jgi:tRNA threonylcarbamoyladenosine modification (KEOPS) complex  Pcc1 subunit
MTEQQDEKTLRLLLRAEFAEFKVQFFNELQAKLDAKADRLPFELLAKDVAELKASAATRKHLEQDMSRLTETVAALAQERAVEDARSSGMWFAFSRGRALLAWCVAAAIAAADVIARLLS